MRTLLIMITILFLVNCSSNRIKNNDENAVDLQNKLTGQVDSEEIHEFDNFKDYLNVIPYLKIPFKYYSEGNFEQTINIISKYRPDGSTIIGRINSINDNHLIIYRYSADILLPILEIYNSQGIKISQYELLDLGFCSNELEMNYGKFEILNDSTIIMENYKILNNDTIVINTSELNLKKILNN